MSQDYSDIGLNGQLFKQSNVGTDKIDPDTQIDDGSIQGIKLMTKSVSLDKLYGQDLVVGGGSNISGSILVNDSSNVSRITMDATNGLTISDNAGDVFSAAISGVTAGQVTIGNYPTQGLRYDTSGNLTINGTITATAGSIGGWTINSTSLYSGSVILDSSTGTISGATIRLPNETLSTGNAGKLIWDSNARIWGDSSGRIGINGSGAADGVYIYAQGITAAIFKNGAQSEFQQGLKVGSDTNPQNLNVWGDTRFRQNVYVDYDNIGFGDGSQGSGGSKLLTIRDSGITFSNNGSQRQMNWGGTYLKIQQGKTLNIADQDFTANIEGGGNARIAWGSGESFRISPGSGNNFSINGNGAKTAIVPTLKGYRALYTNESPDVWFNDFCGGKRIFRMKGWKFWKWGFDYEARPDPMFMEVTSPPYVIIPTATKGLVQVWGKRKGMENMRFEEKTEEEFKKNNDFWNQAKVDNTKV